MSEKEEMFCPICNGIINPEDLLCNNCGASLKENNQMMQKQRIIENPTVQPLYGTPIMVRTIQPTVQTHKQAVYATISLIFTAIAASLFLIPCPCVSIFGGLPVSAIG
ncbi:MAG TPA: hypothetical protein VMZ29_04590 [Candidatus Bathyarchaeia archaeon]|nr:hypothetical protein [Candidatus Bathyarchaeia archaeon]